MRVVIAEDNALMRTGLVMMFADAGHTVLGSAASAEQLAGLIPAVINELDLAVLDIRMPPSHTDEGTRAALALRRQRPQAGILLLSNHIEPRTALRLLQEHPRGFGYLLKDRVLDVDDMLAAAGQIGRGGSVIDPEVVRQLLRRQRNHDPLQHLTPRELEVLALIAEGRSNPAVAAKLSITVKTVERHVAGIFQKLSLSPARDDDRRVRAVLAYLGRYAPGNPFG